MKARRKRELIVSIVALGALAGGLAFSMQYLRSADAGGPGDLLSGVRDIVPPQADVSSTGAVAPVAVMADDATSASSPTSTPTSGPAPAVRAVPAEPAKKAAVAKQDPIPDPIAVIFPSVETVPPQAVIPASVTTSVVSSVQATATPPAAVTAAPVPTTTTTIPLTLPYSVGTFIFGNGFKDGDGWSSWWGSSSETGGFLTVGASVDGTGGGVALAGSNGWTDYTFQATVDWLKGETFGIIARYVDDNNYVVCDFDEPQVGDVRMSIEQYVNGNEIDLANGNIENYNQVGGAGIDVAIAVQGSEGECAFNGNVISTLVASTAITPVQSGEIGFMTWDRTLGNSEIVVHTVGVTAGTYDLGTDSVQD